MALRDEGLRESLRAQGLKKNGLRGSLRNLDSALELGISNVQSGSFLFGNTSVTLGFQPDVVIFAATNTNPSGSLESESSQTADYGWMFGVTDLQNGIDQALFSGSGSNSTNGCASEFSNSIPIDILELSSDGDNISNRAQAAISRTSDGFSVSVQSSGTSELVQYTAYQLTQIGDVDVGSFGNPTSATTKSVSVGFEPDFVKFWGQPRVSSSSGTVQDTNDFGIAHGWLASDTQLSMAEAAFSSNIDDHVYGARDASCLLVKHQASKGGVTGTTEASGTLTTDGFDLSYSTVDGGGSQMMYAAFNAPEGFNIETINAPESATTTPLSNSYRNASIIGSATIDSLNVDGFSGANQNSISFGYTRGVGSPSQQSTLSFGVSSNSTDAHRFFASQSEFARLLFTNSSGGNDGSDDATLTQLDPSGEVEFTGAADGSQTLANSHTTNPLVVWGVA